MLGFSAAVMLAASLWSLLAPAIESSKDYGRFASFPAATGFGLGACALRFSNRLPPHFQLGASMPLRRMGWSRLRRFWYGQLSAVVEPIAAVIGAAAVSVCVPLVPYALAFAAGAMIYVVIEAVIPESREQGNADIVTLGTMLGFMVMMILDVSLG